MIIKEKWEPIANYSGYEVSNFGSVRNSVTKHVMKPWSVHDYQYIGLRAKGCKRNRSVHRLVAEAFIPNPLNKPEVNHLDGDKRNNFVSNLQWSTSSENIQHAIRTGLFTPYKLPPYSKPGKRVRIVETGEMFDSLTDCAKHINGFKTAISACLLGKVKTHMGYHFEEIRD